MPIRIMQYDKKPLSIEQQINHLKQKGLQIDDENDCAFFLSNVSYYRLAWYWKTFLDRQNKQFIHATHFSQIKMLYLIDQELRNLIADSVDTIEIALRAQLVNSSCNYFQDPFWHSKDEWIQSIVIKSKGNSKGGKYCPFNHFDKKYKQNNNPDAKYPFWLVSEFLFFSDISKIYQHINKQHDKLIAKEIAQHFALRPYQFEKCLHSLSVLRNAVAHYDKIYHREFPFKVKSKGFQWISNKEEPFSDKNFFINYFYIIDHLLASIKPENHWRQKVEALLLKNSDVASKYGF